MPSDNNQEMFPIVDEQGNITGAATRGECHSGSKLLHPVIHLHVFNSKGDLYLQKRPEWKDIQPENGTQPLADILTWRKRRNRTQTGSPRRTRHHGLYSRTANQLCIRIGS